MQKRGMPIDTHTYIKTYLYTDMYIIFGLFSLFKMWLKHYSHIHMRKATDVCARVATSMFYVCVLNRFTIILY